MLILPLGTGDADVRAQPGKIWYAVGAFLAGLSHPSTLPG